jgi:hypothetical protein
MVQILIQKYFKNSLLPWILLGERENSLNGLYVGLHADLLAVPRENLGRVHEPVPKAVHVWVYPLECLTAGRHVKGTECKEWSSFILNPVPTNF